MSYYYIDNIYDYTIFHPMSKTCCTAILWLGWYFSPKTMICTAAPKKSRKVVQTLEVKQANEWRNKKHNNLPKQLSWWSSQKLWSGKTWQHPFLCGRFIIPARTPPSTSTFTIATWRSTTNQWTLGGLLLKAGNWQFWVYYFGDLHGFTMSRSGFPWFSTCPFYLLRI